MVLKRHLCYTDLVLATMERSGELIIGFIMANLPYIQNFRSLELPHGLNFLGLSGIGFVLRNLTVFHKSSRA